MNEITSWFYRHLKTQYVWPDVVGAALTASPENRLEVMQKKILKYLKSSNLLWQFTEDTPIGSFVRDFMTQIDYQALYIQIFSDVQEANK